MPVKRENARQLLWLVEQWALAFSAALAESGPAVADSSWRPLGDPSGLGAPEIGVAWWTLRLPAGPSESITIGLAREAQARLAETSAAGEPQPAACLRVLERAAAIAGGAGGSSKAAVEPAAGPAEGNAYALRFRLADGAELESFLVFHDAAAAGEWPLGLPGAAMRERMGMLLKVEVPVTVSLGTATVPLKDTVNLTHGSVVELNRGFDDPVEVVVNGRVVARGDIVVVEEKYAVRIREIYREESGQIWSAMGMHSAA